MRNSAHAGFWIALGLAVLTSGACKQEKSKAGTSGDRKISASANQTGPTEEDFRAARNVMPVSEVAAKLRAGVSSSDVLAEVQRRRIPAKIVDATALELAANVADLQLLAAMKDGRNILTEAQEAAYMKLVADEQSSASKPKQKAVQTR